MPWDIWDLLIGGLLAIFSLLAGLFGFPLPG